LNADPFKVAGMFGQTTFFPVYLHLNEFQSLCTLLYKMLSQLRSLSWSCQ